LVTWRVTSVGVNGRLGTNGSSDEDSAGCDVCTDDDADADTADADVDVAQAVASVGGRYRRLSSVRTCASRRSRDFARTLAMSSSTSA
jgi:hypothetical protein